jgi:hypothetical protein
MIRSIGKILISTVILSCIGCSQYNEESLEQLKILRNHRYRLLEENYKYNVLKDNIGLLDVNRIKTVYSELYTQLENGRIDEVNSILDSMSSRFGIGLKLMKSNGDQATLIGNELLIYEKITEELFKHLIPFGHLSANVFLVSETTEKCEYQVLLVASDSLFRPDVELFLNSDTLPIFVENDGTALITMSKKNVNHQHKLQGDVIVRGDKNSVIRYSFSYSPHR